MSNIYLCALSSLSHIDEKNNKECFDYAVDGIQNLIVKGRYTNDAPTRFVNEIWKKNKILNDKKVIYIASKKCDEICNLTNFKNTQNNSIDFENISTSNYFVELCKNTFDNGIVIEKVAYKENDLNETILDTANKIDYGSKLYIDFTGGLRDASILLAMLINILKVKDVSIEKCIYSDVNTKKIYTIDENIKLSELSEGIVAFTTYGKADILKKVMDDSLVEPIRSCVSSMKEFSDALYLCSVEQLVDSVRKVHKSLNSVKNLKEKNLKSTNEHMFYHLVDTLENNFVKQSHSDDENRIIGETIVNTVRWCNEKQMYQQALTLIESKFFECLHYYNFVFSDNDYIFRDPQTGDSNKKDDRNQRIEDYFLKDLCCYGLKSRKMKTIFPENLDLNQIFGTVDIKNYDEGIIKYWLLKKPISNHSQRRIDYKIPSISIRLSNDKLSEKLTTLVYAKRLRNATNHALGNLNEDIYYRNFQDNGLLNEDEYKLEVNPKNVSECIDRCCNLFEE